MNWQFGDMPLKEIEWFRDKTKRIAKTPTEYQPGTPLRDHFDKINRRIWCMETLLLWDKYISDTR